MARHRPRAVCVEEIRQEPQQKLRKKFSFFPSFSVKKSLEKFRKRFYLSFLFPVTATTIATSTSSTCTNNSIACLSLFMNRYSGDLLGLDGSASDKDPRGHGARHHAKADQSATIARCRRQGQERPSELGARSSGRGARGGFLGCLRVANYTGCSRRAPDASFRPRRRPG